VLDILFVTRLHMTTDGVALATVISPNADGRACLPEANAYAGRAHRGPFRAQAQPEVVRKIFKLGLPVGATQAIFSVQRSSCSR
jgi:Na+-driven multidrug efflux pump